MSLRVDYSVLNQRETPSLFADVFSNRPAFGFNGRLFISIDTKQIFRDYGTNWELIADAGSGSSNLQQVCTNGNFTTTDIDMLSGNLILRNLNPGGVLFTNTSEIVSQDINNFFWDDTNNRLGIGTNTPTAPLDVHSTGNILQQLNGTSTNNTYLAFLNQDIGKWRIGNYYNSGDNDFVIYDTFSGVTRAFFTNTGYTILPTNLIIGSSNRSSAYGMDVYVSANYQSTLRVVGASTFLSQINGTFAELSTSTGGGYTGLTIFNQSTGSAGILLKNATQQWLLNTRTDSKFSIFNATSSTTPFLIDLNGNVGIGTITPQRQFVIANSSNDGLEISNSSGYSTLMAYNRTTSLYQNIVLTEGSGKVLIGTTTDNGDKLQVTGAASFSLENIKSGQQYLRSTSGSQGASTTAVIFRFLNNAGTLSGQNMINGNLRIFVGWNAGYIFGANHYNYTITCSSNGVGVLTLLSSNVVGSNLVTSISAIADGTGTQIVLVTNGTPTIGAAVYVSFNGIYF